MIVCCPITIVVLTLTSGKLTYFWRYLLRLLQLFQLMANIYIYKEGGIRFEMMFQRVVKIIKPSSVAKVDGRRLLKSYYQETNYL